MKKKRKKNSEENRKKDIFLLPYLSRITFRSYVSNLTQIYEQSLNNGYQNVYLYMGVYISLNQQTISK